MSWAEGEWSSPLGPGFTVPQQEQANMTSLLETEVATNGESCEDAPLVDASFAKWALRDAIEAYESARALWRAAARAYHDDDSSDRNSEVLRSWALIWENEAHRTRETVAR